MNARETAAGWVEMIHMCHNDPPLGILTHPPKGISPEARKNVTF